MTVKGPSSAVPSGSPTPSVLHIATLLLSTMLSRFPSLFTYLIVGLVVSAAATPFTNPLGDATKSLSPRPNSMKPMDNRKPYDGDKGRPYRNDDKEGPYRDGDKDKHYDDDKSEHHGQCSVENQHCCNQVNEVNYICSSSVDSSLTYCSRRATLPNSRLSVKASLDFSVSSSLSRSRTSSGASIVLPFWASIRHARINKSVAKTITW